MFRNYQSRPIQLRGAIIKQDDDPIKQSPIMDVEISEANGLATTSTKSNFTGFFTLPLIRGVSQNQSVTLRFLHPDYVPLELTELVSDKLIVVHLVPIRRDTEEEPVPTDHPAITVANVRIRYSTEVHHAGEYRHRGKDFSGSKRRQHSLPEQRTLLTGRQVESGCQFRVPGCG